MSDPILRLFAERPELKGRLIRAAVVRIRSMGLRLEDRRPASWSLRGDTIAVLDEDDEDIVRFRVDELSGPVD